MKKNLGFTRFEFYFVMSAIGVIALIAIQRYLTLTEETQRFSFEMVARNFNAVVYNQHTRWMMSRQKQTTNAQLNIDGLNIQFSPQGWPLAVVADAQASNQALVGVSVKVSVEAPVEVSIKTCLSLWQNFLQNPPALSYEGGDAYGTRSYHLSLPRAGKCRFEFITKNPNEFYVDYNPSSGDVTFHTPPFVQK